MVTGPDSYRDRSSYILYDRIRRKRAVLNVGSRAIYFLNFFSSSRAIIIR